MKTIITLGLTICISIICIGQSISNVECKSLLNVDPTYETIEKIHYIFTGSDTTGLNVKVTKIKVVEGRTEMVKRRDKNCIAPNIEDCYVMVKEEIPPVTMNLYTLSGPDQTPEYDTRKENVTVVKVEGGQKEINIVCPKNRSKNLIKKVQNALIAEGYPLTINGVYDQATQLSVTDFQRSKGLAYGDLTLEVLAALKVK